MCLRVEARAFVSVFGVNVCEHVAHTHTHTSCPAVLPILSNRFMTMAIGARSTTMKMVRKGCSATHTTSPPTEKITPDTHTYIQDNQ